MIINTEEPEMIAKMLASGWIRVIDGERYAYYWPKPLPRC